MAINADHLNEDDLDGTESIALYDKKKGARKTTPDGLKEFVFIPVWDDLRFPVTTINPRGTVSDPDVDDTDGALLFSATAEESIYIIAQMQHDWLEGSEIHPHVHWTRSIAGGGNVAWKISYSITSVGDVFSAQTTETVFVVSTTDDLVADQHMITAFSPVDMTGHRVSSILKITISRDGANVNDTCTTDVKLLEFDIHYQKDSLGSLQEYTK